MSRAGASIHAERLTDAEQPEPVLDALLAATGGLEQRVRAGDLVLIKPNFVAPFPKATTDLRFVDYFVNQVRRLGATPVLGESSGFEFDTRSTFRVLGVDEFAKARNLELVNFEDGDFVEVGLGAGLPSVAIARLAFDAKLIINLPVLKGHTVTRMTGAVKNLFGLVKRESRRYLHGQKLEPSIAAITRRLGHALHFVDARRELQRAVFAESRPLGYALSGVDPFALDHFGARLLGIDPAWVGHLVDVPDYRVGGAQVDSFPRPCRRNSLRQRVHRALYSAFYWADHAKDRTLGGKSIIYDLHWYLGIHPVLRNVSEAEARSVAASCPVGAVDVSRRTIIKQACHAVRCLNCHREHPALVELRGLNRPRGENVGA